MNPAIVLTGATSGFGAAALSILAKMTEMPIIVGARNPEPLNAEYGTRVRALPLDLTSLESVRGFCTALSDTQIGVLAMNAGMQTRTITETDDGFETTFQVNYLSHFLMFDILKNQLTDDALVVTTGSGTHDPEEKTPVPPPKHANVEWLANPEKDPQPDRFAPLRSARAYSTSKLLCIMMAMEVAQRFPILRAVSFDPGYLPDTRLAREYPALLASIIKRIVPLTMKNDRSGSVATTAPEYARILKRDISANENGGYIVMRGGNAVETTPSELARTPGLARKMWDDTLALLSGS